MAKGKGGGGGGVPKDPTIYGTIGNDIISLAGAVDHGDMVDGLAGNDTITGSNFADFLYGNDGDDRIFGGGGDDWIEGGLGNDYMDGGASSYDWVTFGRAANGVTVDLAITTAQNTGVGLDTILNFENVSGSNFNDTVRGNASSNWLNAGTGNDVVEGRGGDDLLQDNGGSDRFYGGDGNDTIMDYFGLATESDYIDGGLGNDTLYYDSQYLTGALKIDLRILTAQNTGAAGVDTIINIENVSGSSAADTLIGNDANNILNGGGASARFVPVGADVIYGMGGNDTITSYGFADGGAGNDWVYGQTSAYGGDGNDTVISSDFYGVNIADGGAGDDIVSSTAIARGGAGNDKIAGATMTGGLGADWFSAANGTWTTSLATSGGQLESTVTDFSRAQLDKIDLAAFFHSLGITGTFVGSGPFTSFVGHAEARIVAGATVQNVEIDISGDRIADYIMHVNGSTPLIASDFILV